MNENRRRATEDWWSDSRRLEAERIKHPIEVGPELDSEERKHTGPCIKSPEMAESDERRYTCTKCGKEYKQAGIEVFSPVICLLCKRGWNSGSSQ